MRWLVAVVFFLTACSSGGETVKETKEASVGPPQPWETMPFAAKKAYMNDTVMPAAKKLFVAFDAGTYADFGCETCHGIEAEERNFEMPNPDLHGLYPTGHPEQIALVKREKKILMFMFQKVLPTVQKLVGAPVWDDKTKTGFSCFTCHPAGT